MLHKNFAGMMACILVLFAGQALAGECFTLAAEGVTVNQCADQPPMFLLPQGEGGLKVEPLSAHQDGFGQIGMHGFYAADQGGQTKTVEVAAASNPAAGSQPPINPAASNASTGNALPIFEFHPANVLEQKSFTAPGVLGAGK